MINLVRNCPWQVPFVATIWYWGGERMDSADLRNMWIVHQPPAYWLRYGTMIAIGEPKV